MQSVKINWVCGLDGCTIQTSKRCVCVCVWLVVEECVRFVSFRRPWSVRFDSVAVNPRDCLQMNGPVMFSHVLYCVIGFVLCLCCVVFQGTVRYGVGRPAFLLMV